MHERIFFCKIKENNKMFYLLLNLFAFSKMISNLPFNQKCILFIRIYKQKYASMFINYNCLGETK